MKKLGTDFTEGNITKHLVKFLLPFLLASILNSVYNMVDMVIIGAFVGSVGTVAVSLGGKMLNFFTQVSIGLAGGGQVLISQETGANKKDVNSTIGTLFCALTVISICISVVCFLLSYQILIWLNTPQEAMVSALAYLRITCIGLPLVFGYNAVCSVLRGMGDSKRPLLFIAIAALMNLILDLIFVLGFQMGAVGTALATIMGQGASFIFSIVYLYRRKEQFGFDFKKSSFVIVPEKLKKILGLGVPIAGQSAFIYITQLIVVSHVNSYGLIQSAAYSIGDKIVTLTNITTSCTKQAGASIIGQNLGAGKKERAKETVHAALKVTLTISTLLTAICLMFPDAVFGIFTHEPEVMAYSARFMMITALVYYLSSFSSAFSAMTLGAGNSKLCMFGGILDGVVFRLAFSFFFGIYCNMEVTGFFLGNALARVAMVLVHGTYYLSGAWKRRKTLVELDVEKKNEVM